MSTIFAETEFKNEHLRFTMNPEDRLRGVFLLGKSGMGKTEELVSLALQDCAAGFSVFFIDSSGEAVQDILRRLPPSRLKDVVLYSPKAHDSIASAAFLKKEIKHPIVLLDSSRRRLSSETSRHWEEKFLEAVYSFALSDEAPQGYVASLFMDEPSILSGEVFLRFLQESSKLGIAVTLAAQYSSEFSATSFEATLSSLGTFGLFQLGSHDAHYFQKVLAPQFSAPYLASLPKGSFVTNLTNEGRALPIFAARSLSPSRLGFPIQVQSVASVHHVPHVPVSENKGGAPEVPGELLDKLLDVDFKVS